MAEYNPNDDQSLEDMYGSRESDGNVIGDSINKGRKAKQAAKAAQKAAKTAAKASKTAAKRAIAKALLAAAPYIATALVILVLLILIIGFIAFLFSGPDMLRGQIVQMADEFWTAAKKALVDFTAGPDYAEATEEHVTDVGKYIEYMGYKLEGWGFVDTSKGDKVERDNEQNVKKVESLAITEYLAAENRTYMLSTVSVSSIYRYLAGKISSGLSSATVSGSTQSNQTGNNQTATQNTQSIAQNSDYRTGMINISPKVAPVKLEIDGKVVHDDLANSKTTGVEKITPEVERASKKLILKINQKKVVDGQTKNIETKCTYNLDGWVGRYGKPIEFLLALHLGTMAPDFAKTIAMGTDFDTRVNIKIHKSVEVYKLTWRGENVEDVLKKFNADYTERLNQLLAENRAARSAYPPRPDPWPNPSQAALEWTEWRYGCTKSELEKAVKYQKEQVTEKYTPYIVRVKNHWYRDVVFKEYLGVASDKDAYVQAKPGKKSGGLYLSKFQVDIYTSGDIYQVKEPRLGPVNEKLEDLINNKTWVKITGVAGETNVGKIEFKDEMANAVVMLDKAAQKSDDAKFISRDLKEWLAIHDFKFRDSHILSYEEEKEIEINKDDAKSPESEEEEFMINLNPNATPSGTSGGGGGSFGTGTPTNVGGTEGLIIQAMDYLINEQGFTIEAAAGVCGNIAAECSWNPNAVNEYGYSGIFQWHPTDRWPFIRDWLTGQGLEIGNVMNQLKAAFNSEDYTYEKGNVAAVKGITNVEEAAYAWGDKWERCHEYVNGKPTARLQGEQERKDYARGAYEVYQKNKNGTTTNTNNGTAVATAKITTTNEPNAISQTLGTAKTAEIVYKGSRATYKTAELENDIDVKSLLAGTVEKVSKDTIQIKGNTENYDNVTIILTGANINTDLKVGDMIEQNQQIAKTILGKDVRIQVQDEDRKAVSIEKVLNM